MPNDGVYGSRMPADNVGHETEAVFGREESYLSTWLALGFSKACSQIISLIKLFTKLFQQLVIPCHPSDFETGPQNISYRSLPVGTQRQSQLGLNVLDFPLGPCVFLACRKVAWDFKSVRREMRIAARPLAHSTRDQNAGVTEMGLSCL